MYFQKYLQGIVLAVVRGWPMCRVVTELHSAPNHAKTSTGTTDAVTRQSQS